MELDLDASRPDLGSLGSTRVMFMSMFIFVLLLLILVLDGKALEQTGARYRLEQRSSPQTGGRRSSAACVGLKQFGCSEDRLRLPSAGTFSTFGENGRR